MEKYGGVTAEGIVESALDKVRMIEELDYHNIVISIKSSDVMMCVRAHELIADKTDYPLHVGITGSGAVFCSCFSGSALEACGCLVPGPVSAAGISGVFMFLSSAMYKVPPVLGIKNGPDVLSDPVTWLLLSLP